MLWSHKSSSILFNYLGGKAEKTVTSEKKGKGKGEEFNRVHFGTAAQLTQTD